MYGVPYVVLAAPGDGRVAPLPGGAYGGGGGTFNATPYVADLAAMVQMADPQLSAAATLRLLISTSTPHPGLAGKVVAGGIVSSEGAKRMAAITAAQRRGETREAAAEALGLPVSEQDWALARQLIEEDHGNMSRTFGAPLSGPGVVARRGCDEDGTSASGELLVSDLWFDADDEPWIALQEGGDPVRVAPTLAAWLAEAISRKTPVGLGFDGPRHDLKVSFHEYRPGHV